MLELNFKQLLALVVCVLLINPNPIIADSSAGASRDVLGSISAQGVVRVGDTLTPTAGTLFSGDEVQTNVGSALIQYQEGTRVQLGIETNAVFTSSQTQLNKGQMEFRTVSLKAPAIAASTLRLEPATAVSVAVVTLQDKKANVSVTEGTLNIVDPTGVQLASLHAGQTGVFQEASAALPAQAAGGPAASAFIGTVAAIWILVVVAAATTTLVVVAQDDDKPSVSPF